MSILLDEVSQKTLLNLARPLTPQQREAFYLRVAEEISLRSTGLHPDQVLGPGLIARLGAKVQREFLGQQPALDGRDL
jgi:hypothetical protein